MITYRPFSISKLKYSYLFCKINMVTQFTNVASSEKNKLISYVILPCISTTVLNSPLKIVLFKRYGNDWICS